MRSRPGRSRLRPLSPGRKDVTLRKLDFNVETVNREPLTMHSDREDDTASVSTATRVMKAIYSVSVRSPSPPRPTLFFTLLWPAPPQVTKAATLCPLS